MKKMLLNKKNLYIKLTAVLILMIVGYWGFIRHLSRKLRPVSVLIFWMIPGNGWDR